MPLLSIVIPTRDRPQCAAALVRLLSHAPESLRSMSEILVSDNSVRHSLGDDVLAPAKGRFLSARLVKASNSFATAEEHIRWVTSEAAGQYTWICGDNDVPLVSGMERLASLLVESSHPRALLFGCDVQRPNGVLVPTRGAFGSRDFAGASGLTVVQRAGFTHQAAGISNWVVPTSSWRASIFEQLIDAGLSIYSHVTTLLWSLSSIETWYIAQPLTRYTLEDYSLGSSDHWLAYTSTRGKYAHQPWTLDLFSQLKLLVDEKVATWPDFGAIMDGGDGLAARLPLPVMVIDHLVRQIEEVGVSRRFPIKTRARALPSRSQWLSCLDLLWKMDSRLAPVLSQMEPPAALRSRSAEQWGEDMRSALSDFTSTSTSHYWINRRDGLCRVSDGVGTWLFANTVREHQIARVMERVNRDPLVGDRWIQLDKLDLSLDIYAQVLQVQAVLDGGASDKEHDVPVGSLPEISAVAAVDLERLRTMIGLARYAYRRLPRPVRKSLVGLSRRN